MSPSCPAAGAVEQSPTRNLQQGLGKGCAKGVVSQVWFQIWTAEGWMYPSPSLSRPARHQEAVAVVAGGHQTLMSCPRPDGAG